MSQRPYEGQGTPDPHEAVLDPDDEAERADRSEAFDPFNPGDPIDSEINPYDTSWVPPDRPPGHGDWGTTLAEERQGEPLDGRLAEEEPDILAEIGADDPGAAERAAAEAAAPDDAELPEIAAVLAEAGGNTNAPEPDYAEPDPRSGRLVADDEGAHPDEESQLVARDVGISGAAASAEEAAVHIVDEP